MIKIDKYLEARGGTAHMINVSCAKCGKKIYSIRRMGQGGLNVAI